MQHLLGNKHLTEILKNKCAHAEVQRFFHKFRQMSMKAASIKLFISITPMNMMMILK